MSLLMNALKKAETAKAAGEADAAQPDAPISAGAPKRDLTEELGLDPHPGAAARARGTKSEPLLPPQTVVAPTRGLALELEPETGATLAGETPAIESDNVPSASASARARTAADSTRSVRNVFNAKKSIPAKTNSRTPFYVLIGLCLLAGGGYAAYIWQQMQPPSPASLAARNITPSPVPAASAQPTAPSIEPPQDVVADKEPMAGSNSAAANAASSAHTPAGMSASSGARDSRSENGGSFSPAEPPLRDRVSPANGGRGGPALRRDIARAEGGTAVDSPANLSISRTTAPAAVNPDVAAGYSALQGGDLNGATQAYERALRADPTSRDALLGVATIQLRLNRVDAAEASFRRVLRLHPQDSYAAAQLAALQAGSDPLGALSQVNSLIAREAGGADASNSALPFIQGNQLAAQGRWNEAQQAYFNAHRADPNNPDFCYNLAVSLDRIHESRLARDFYAKALELARSRAAGFDTTRAQTRLGQLGGAAK